MSDINCAVRSLRVRRLVWLINEATLLSYIYKSANSLFSFLFVSGDVAEKSSRYLFDARVYCVARISRVISLLNAPQLCSPSRKSLSARASAILGFSLLYHSFSSALLRLQLELMPPVSGGHSLYAIRSSLFPVPSTFSSRHSLLPSLLLFVLLALSIRALSGYVDDSTKVPQLSIAQRNKYFKRTRLFE